MKNVVGPGHWAGPQPIGVWVPINSVGSSRDERRLLCLSPTFSHSTTGDSGATNDGRAATMLRLSRFLPSTSRRVCDLKEVFWSGSLTFEHALSTSAANYDENASAKKFANYTVFKGKAALSISPILPVFSKPESGGSRVNRNGSVMLTFFPAVGQRKYDFTKKQLFALSPTEVGSLISLGPAESCEFFHDPSMKSSHEGQVKKSLSITPLGNDNGYFLNISVMDNVQKTNERMSVPVTKAEFAVMRTALSFALPHIMGWDQALTSHPQSPSAPASRPRVERPNPDSEWDR
uniref:Uncharacterized protein n=1 Tax=Avena sativa TaxID=4498 RepID=A0ACD5Z1S4_AVESA